jgi:aryl-alcohol dehydrogenase-like predicted oxidoreductase
MTMRKVKLGSQGALVSRMGLGCMGMSEFYGERNDAESASTRAGSSSRAARPDR